jgi:hypothetical protein
MRTRLLLLLRRAQADRSKEDSCSMQQQLLRAGKKSQNSLCRLRKVETARKHHHHRLRLAQWQNPLLLMLSQRANRQSRQSRDCLRRASRGMPLPLCPLETVEHVSPLLCDK